MDNYRELLKKAEEYKKTKFWSYISGDDIFKIKGYDRNVYVSVMGSVGVNYGIAIFKGDDELFSQLDATFGEYEKFPDMFNRLEMYKVELFDVGHMLNDQDKKKLSKYGIKSKDHVFKLEPGFLPRIVGEDECKFIMNVLDDIILIAKYILKKKLEMIDQILLEKMYAFDIKDGVVKHSKINYPTKQDKKIKTEELDNSIVSKLLMTKQRGTYHVGLFYSPDFIREERWYYPLMLFVVEEKSRMILGVTMIKKEEISNVPNKLIDIFAKNNLVPENISFTDEPLSLLCKDVLIELKIKYTIDDEDELLFDIWEDMADQLAVR